MWFSTFIVAVYTPSDTLFAVYHLISFWLEEHHIGICTDSTPDGATNPFTVTLNVPFVPLISLTSTEAAIGLVLTAHVVFAMNSFFPFLVVQYACTWYAPNSLWFLTLNVYV